MVKYKFKNKGLKLYDLLTFALALRPEDRGWFIQNLGKDIFGYYSRDIINVFYYNTIFYFLLLIKSFCKTVSFKSYSKNSE